MEPDLDKRNMPAGPETNPGGETEQKQPISEETPVNQPPQDPAEQHPRRRRRAAQQAAEAGPEAGPKNAPESGTEPEPAATGPEAEPETDGTGMPEEFYPMDRCCICNHPLDTGCAILFTDEHGMARIDENCCKSLEVAARSMDKAAVARAFDFFAAWTPYVKQPVADYLKNYLRVVQTFLNS